MQFQKEFIDQIDQNKHHSYTIENTNTLEGYPKIMGYDFEKKFSFDDFIESYSATGFQATNLGIAINIIRTMRKENAKIFLSYTSNMISSGVRESIKFLVKNKLVDFIVTSAGGIEEDLIKTFKPFVIGKFEVSGKMLFEQGINRTGNIFVPNDRFYYFEKFITPILQKIHAEAIKPNKSVVKNTPTNNNNNNNNNAIIYTPISTHELIRRLGEEINNEESVVYWAAKNNIPIICPGIMDGSFGDVVTFFKHSNPDFFIDVTDDMKKITQFALNSDKTGLIILGGGSAKHYTLNAQIFREGADFCVYINTGDEFDGSDSGARPDEAVSWAKIKHTGQSVKVWGDASIIFPLVVAATFKKEFDINNS